MGFLDKIFGSRNVKEIPKISLSDIDKGQTLGENIRIIRRKHKITQGVLGSYIGLSRVSIVNIEKGRQHPPVDTLMKICAIFNCSPADILPPVPKFKIKYVNNKAEIIWN